MRIFTHGKELLLIMTLLLTTFATINNNSPKISRPVTPSAFFARGSLIEDYYYGHLSAAQTKVALSELSFVFYYAPWSQESKHARAAYEHVSRLFYKEAYFAAINCWQPGSECRNQYSKISQWPILMAYQRNGFGIQYQKNLWTEGALTKFINSLMNPFERLTAPEDLMEMMISRDCVIVAFLDLEANPRHYKSFQRTALKFLERDPFNEVGFGMVIGETADEFGVSDVPTLRAYLWNETIEYEGNTTWNSRDILSWVHKTIQQVRCFCNLMSHELQKIYFTGHYSFIPSWNKIIVNCTVYQSWSSSHSLYAKKFLFRYHGLVCYVKAARNGIL